MTVSLGRLTRRPDFLRVAEGRLKFAAKGVVLQARRAPAETGAEGVRLGFTATRKIGSAVERNRARRRLREAARLVMPEAGSPGWDYVLVARADTLTRPFVQLTEDLRAAALALARAADKGPGK